MSLDAMLEVSQLAANVFQDDSGLWVSRNRSDVSYPADGSEACFAVEERSFWFNHRNRIITSLVEAFSPAATVFDIGGGNGFVAMALQRAGIECVLVEPSPQGARHARARGVATVIQSTLLDAGFQPGSMPACGLFDVLEHIDGDRAFLQAVHRCLQPGASLYLTVPAWNALWSVDDDFAGHFRRYSLRGLRGVLESAGFSVVYCSYFFWFLVPAVFLFRSVPSRLGIRRSITASTVTAEHTPPQGLAGRVLERCQAIELTAIQSGRQIPFGSSCVAVARKAK